MNLDQTQASTRTLWTIYAAFLGAPIFYAIMGFVINSSREDAAYPVPVGYVLPLVAVGSIVAAYFVPRAIWTRAAALRASDPQEALNAYQTGMIIHWACFEAVAIYGFVLTIISGMPLAGLVGTVVAVAFLATARPQPGNLGIRV